MINPLRIKSWIGRIAGGTIWLGISSALKNSRAILSSLICMGSLILIDAVKTISEYVKKNKSLIINLLYLDCPIYKPTITALNFFYPLIPKGGVVAFDEIAMEKWKGETIAFKEYFGKNFPRLKRFYFEPSASYFIKE